MKFFVAGADDIRFYLVRRNDLNLMFTAGHHFKGKARKFHLDIPIPHERLFIDSGGFQFFSRFKDYPFTVSEYVHWVHEVNPDMFATLDYPCEPELIKKNKSTVRGNIDKTVERAGEIFEHSIDPSIQVVPVIQGWEKRDYLECIDKYQTYGLISDYMAIGTLCRRGDTRTILSIARSIRKELPSYVKLHGFGVKVGLLQERELYSIFESIDSASWVSEVRAGNICIFTGKKLLRVPYHGLPISSHERLSISLDGYVKYVEYLIQHNEKTGETLIPYIQKDE